MLTHVHCNRRSCSCWLALQCQYNNLTGSMRQHAVLNDPRCLHEAYPRSDRKFVVFMPVSYQPSIIPGSSCSKTACIILEPC